MIYSGLHFLRGAYSRRLFIMLASLSTAVLGWYGLAALNINVSSVERVKAASPTRATPLPPPASFESQLQSAVQTFVESTNHTAAVDIHDYASNETTGANEDSIMDAASLYKLFIAHRALELSDSGELSLNETLLKTEARSIKDCIRASIVVSDNPCGKALQARVNAEEATNVFRSRGYSQTTMSGVFPRTTAADASRLLDDIHTGIYLSNKSHNLLLSYLQEQTINYRLPAQLPKSANVAHKTGDLAHVAHDIGIITNGSSVYSIVIMTEDWHAPLAEKNTTMAAFSRTIYDLFAEIYTS